MQAEEEGSLLRVLICDDDPADRKLTRTYLRQIAGREVVVVEAGRVDEIQSALERGRIDLVLMDMQMPEKSGMEWLAEIVARETAPVVVLTGTGSEEMAAQAIQEGAVGYLSKGSLSRDRITATVDAALEKWRWLRQGRADQEELERLANYDALTGLYNRRVILRTLDEGIRHAVRHNGELGLIMLDLDHFKDVNDRYGHIVGDEVLERVAALIRENIRDLDAAGRYGGEEFLVLLSEATLESARDVAERIRRAVESARTADPHGGEFGITVSLGVSGWHDGEDGQSVISRADEALYRAKRAGRNRVELSPAGSAGGEAQP